MFIGGAFLRNSSKRNSDGSLTTNAYQETNPRVLGLIDDAYNKPIGTSISHEMTEAYTGAKMAQEYGGISIPSAAALPRIPGSALPSFYDKAHSANTTTKPSGAVYIYFFNAEGVHIPSSAGATSIRIFTQPGGPGTPQRLLEAFNGSIY